MNEYGLCVNGRKTDLVSGNIRKVEVRKSNALGRFHTCRKAQEVLPSGCFLVKGLYVAGLRIYGLERVASAAEMQSVGVLAECCKIVYRFVKYRNDGK